MIGSIWQMLISPPSLLKEVHPPAVFDGREREDAPPLGDLRACLDRTNHPWARSRVVLTPDS